MLPVAKQQRTPAILQQLRNLVGMKSGIEWDRRASAGDDAQVSRDPARMIVSQNCDAGVPRELLFSQPVANRLRHLSKFGVGVAFNPVPPLDFERNVIRPALGALAKAVVERGHGSRGILHETEV